MQAMTLTPGASESAESPDSDASSDLARSPYSAPSPAAPESPRLDEAPKKTVGNIPKGIPKGDTGVKSLFPLAAPTAPEAPLLPDAARATGPPAATGASPMTDAPEKPVRQALAPEGKADLPVRSAVLAAAQKPLAPSAEDVDRSAVFGTDEETYSRVAHQALERWGALPPCPETGELADLRGLVMQREIALLEKIKARLDDPFLHAKDVSGIIAEALLLRAKKDSKLGKALEPVVGDILKTVLRKNPIEFANIIFPLMGPAIRRSIAEAFRSMLEGFNKSIEIAFSWKGLRWRMEALRTGKPFSEVVLLHNLVYRVDQVFFIHSSTGLVLGHVVNEGTDIQDVDMVSAMLTAVQDFVRDCFSGTTGSGGDLESLHMGESVILLEKNPFASLACIVRGQPPADFRNHMRASLELLLIQYAGQLAEFDGDSDQFKGATPYLEDCLASRFADEGKPLPLWIRFLPTALVLGAVLFYGLMKWDDYRLDQAREFNRLAAEQYRAEMLHGVSILKQARGLLVTDVREVHNGVWEVTAMKDDLAPAPEEILRAAGFLPARFNLTVVPFVSYSPDLITERVSNAIRPPSSVTMTFSTNGTLSFSGAAPMAWILSAHAAALSLPGVKAVDMKDLEDPRMSAISYMVKHIESVVIEFPLGKDIPVGAEATKLEEVVATLVRLDSLAREMGLSVDLTVYGHADRVGSQKRNYEISQERARTIAAMLYAKGSSMSISLYGFGSDYSKERTPGQSDSASIRQSGDTVGDKASRRIEFRVHLRQAGDATPDVLKK